MAVKLNGTTALIKTSLVVQVKNNTGEEEATLIWIWIFFRLMEDLNLNLRNFKYEYILGSTGCEKPCKYRKYGLVDQQPTLLDSDHFTLSLWVSELLMCWQYAFNFISSENTKGNLQQDNGWTGDFDLSLVLIGEQSTLKSIIIKVSWSMKRDFLRIGQQGGQYQCIW